MDICVFQIGLCTACYMNAPFHYRLHHLDVGYCRLSLDGDYVMPMGGRWPRDAGRPWPRLIATTAVYSLQPLSITNRLRSSFPRMLDTRNNDTMYACVPHYDQSGSGGVPFWRVYLFSSQNGNFEHTSGIVKLMFGYMCNLTIMYPISWLV